MSDPHFHLRLNVGFIVHQSIGFSREFLVEIPKIHLQPDLYLSNLDGNVRVTRTPQGLLVQAKMEALTSVECVRCLSSFEQHLVTNFSELYAFNRRSVTDSNLILPENGQINLEPVLREYLFLEMPISPLCKPDCKGLCPICGEDLNTKTCDHSTSGGDDRLSALKSLL